MLLQRSILHTGVLAVVTGQQANNNKQGRLTINAGTAGFT
jgi:hypothetical protein